MTSAPAFNATAHERGHFAAMLALGWLPPEFAQLAPGSVNEALAVAKLQDEIGARNDGMLGPGTIGALRRNAQPAWAATPIPHGRAEVDRVYGDPKPSPRPDGRLDVSAAWVKASIVAQPLTGGHVARVHRLVASELAFLHAVAVKASGYDPSFDGGFVPRCKNWQPTNSPSVHTWGAAVDFDAAHNGRGRASGTGMRLHRVFVAVFECGGWTWGGEFPTADDMHFQRADGI